MIEKECKIKIDSEGIPSICLDEIKITDNEKEILVDLTGTNSIVPKKNTWYAEWNFEYNYKTKQWEEVKE